MHVGSGSGPITEINVTPLVDIILVLLIIFMSVAPIIQKRAIKVDVPKAAQHERSATEAVQVVLNAKREIYLSGKRVSEGELAVSLKRLVGLQAALPVTLAADRGIPYGEIVSLLDTVRATGVRKIGLEVQRK